MVSFADKVDPKDTWDWPFILFTGINWLGYTEEEVWRLTPRKWEALVSVYVDIERQKWGGESTRKQTTEEVVTGYIDELGW